MLAQAVVEEMDNLGIGVVAHLIHNHVHEYNVPKRKVLEMSQDITVMKWSRDEGVGRNWRKGKSGKKALYQLSNQRS